MTANPKNKKKKMPRPKVRQILPVEMVDGIQDAALVHVGGMVRLGIDALKASPAPRQRISGEKLQNIARECIVGPNDYAKVSVQNGVVVAAVCAVVDEQILFERKQASVIQFYTTAPGEGIKLIRDFLRWARAQRKIKSIVFMLEVDADPRICKMLERMGLSSRMPTYVEWR